MRLDVFEPLPHDNFHFGTHALGFSVEVEASIENGIDYLFDRPAPSCSIRATGATKVGDASVWDMVRIPNSTVN
jgi:hypothetical protein